MIRVGQKVRFDPFKHMTYLGVNEDRLYLYKCAADTPVVTTDRFMDYEEAVIELRSLYIPYCPASAMKAR